jgi:dipeptidyl aminopeptidase/acylaminoacyl peptidase
MAQYFATKGYIVLQPNFRGSTGFGNDFRLAGRGKWGKEMQDDVSDGVKTLIDSGYVDPERVCIIGASYGGYSALAGGAFTPNLYRCVISINGVSDLPLMIGQSKRKYGRDHWVISYWHQVIGDSKTEREKLKSISPVNFAAQFNAPVMLIHGDDDTVVPIDQSKRMYKALKKAGKPVTFVELDGEDHWLSTSETRLQMLKAIDQFLDTHNPADK